MVRSALHVREALPLAGVPAPLALCKDAAANS